MSEHQAHHSSAEDNAVLCHGECSPWDKDLQPSCLPGLQQFHLWQALEPHPCCQAPSSCVLQQWLLSKGLWVQPHVGSALWAWTPELCCSELVSSGSTVVPHLQCPSYRPRTAFGRTINLLIPQASGLFAGGSSWRSPPRGRAELAVATSLGCAEPAPCGPQRRSLWPPAWAVREGLCFVAAGQGWQEKLPHTFASCVNPLVLPWQVPHCTFNSSCIQPAYNFSFGKALQKSWKNFFSFWCNILTSLQT